MSQDDTPPAAQVHHLLLADVLAAEVAERLTARYPDLETRVVPEGRLPTPTSPGPMPTPGSSCPRTSIARTS